MIRQLEATPYDIFSLGSYTADKRFVLNIIQEVWTPAGHTTPSNLELAEKLLFRLVILGKWGQS